MFKNLFRRSGDTAALSLPKSIKVRGYTVKRLSNGRFLQALEALQGMPIDILTACFPGTPATKILSQLTEPTSDTLLEIAGNLLIAAPRHLIKVVAQLTDIDEQALLDDEDIGLDGLMEIMTAWVEVNNLGNFLPAARALVMKLRTATGSRPQNTGSSDSSPKA